MSWDVAMTDPMTIRRRCSGCPVTLRCGFQDSHNTALPSSCPAIIVLKKHSPARSLPDLSKRPDACQWPVGYLRLSHDLALAMFGRPCPGSRCPPGLSKPDLGWLCAHPSFLPTGGFFTPKNRGASMVLQALPNPLSTLPLSEADIGNVQCIRCVMPTTTCRDGRLA